MHQQIIINCPVCNSKIQELLLERHMQNVHGYQDGYQDDSGDDEYNDNIEDYQNDNDDGEDNDNIEDYQDDNNDGEDEAYSDLEHDYLDRNKSDGTAFFARENGKFGSMPIYDNYSDESDPN